MINTADYKIEIKFDQYRQPYYDVFCKNEPYTIQPEDYRMLAETFNNLGFSCKRKATEEEQMAKMKANVKEGLSDLDVNQARRLLSYEGKRLWVDIHNAKTGGHCYTLAANGDIVDVPMGGVWR